MKSLIRVVLPAAALAAGLTMLTTGCRSASAGTAAPASTAPAASTSSPTAAPVVYLVEGGSVTGTWLHAPACASDCVLCGDSTVALSHMTWSTWNSTTAVGTGTEKLDDCTPNCAVGTLHPVPVKVTLSKPVLVCVHGKGTWFWTRTSFTYLTPLPKAFAGDNAPLDPFDYDGLAAQAAKTCP